MKKKNLFLRSYKYSYVILFLFFVVTAGLEASRFSVADGNLGVAYPLWSYRLFASAPELEDIYDVVVYSNGRQNFPKGVVIKDYFAKVFRKQRMPVHRSIYRMAEKLERKDIHGFEQVKKVFESYVFRGVEEPSYLIKRVRINHLDFYHTKEVVESEVLYCVGDLACEKTN